jgi:hypothetical protein
MRYRPFIRESLEFLAENGLNARVERGRKHPKIRFRNAQGAACTVTVPCSPSRQSAGKATRGELRRQMRREPNGR